MVAALKFLYVLLSLLITTALIQVAQSRTLDETVPSGNNYDKAEFRLWLPEELAKEPDRIRAIYQVQATRVEPVGKLTLELRTEKLL
jgi:hypothetical protein